MGQWIVGVISFQKIFGLCGLRGHKVEIRWDVTIVDNGRTECEDRAILKQNSQLEHLSFAQLYDVYFSLQCYLHQFLEKIILTWPE